MYRHVISLCLALIRGERTNSPKQLHVFRPHLQLGLIILKNIFPTIFYCESLVSISLMTGHLKFITASNRASLDQDLDSILSGGNDGKPGLFLTLF